MEGKKLSSVSPKQFLIKLLISEYFILMMSVVFFLVVGIFRPKIFNGATIYNIFYNMCPLLCVSLGQTFVLLLGGIDLSQTAVISFTSTVAGILIGNKFPEIKFKNTPIWGTFVSEKGGFFSGMPEIAGTVCAIIVIILIGALIGYINGLFIAKLNMPPFMMTLVSQMLWSALSLWIVASSNCMNINPSFCYLGKGKIAGFFPMSAVVAILVLILCELLLSRTIWGKWIYSVGANPRAAVVSGIPKDRIILLCYSLSSVCATVGAIIYSGRLEMGRPTLGDGVLNDVLGAAVIGGVSMYGGKGKALWALYGTFFYCIMVSALNLFHLNSFLIQVIKGCVILAAVSLDIVRTNLQHKITTTK